MKIGTVIGALEPERSAPGMEHIKWVQIRTEEESLTAADPIGVKKGQTVLLATGNAALGYQMGLCADALVAAVLK